MSNSLSLSFRHGKALLFSFLLIAALTSTEAVAQHATLRGFVSDASDGAPVGLANLVVEALEGDFVEGAATSNEGVYVFPRLDPGDYALRATYIGYRTYRDTLTLAPGEVRTLNIELTPDTEILDEVVVQEERGAGAGRMTAGQQTIRPAEIEAVPTPDLSADLAGYLTSLPSTVTTGDRGGQFFIRGGEPSQNLVLLDGMPVYQPFHLLGFYSAFPADVLRSADFYAGGFGSRFGGRLSSVLDVTVRNGNLRGYEGAVTVSPFLSSVLAEGPVYPGRASLLISARRSFLQEGAEHLASTPLPFEFGDALAKLHVETSDATRLSFTALDAYDRGTLVDAAVDADAEEMRWRNRAYGARFVALPRVAPFMGEVQVSYSLLESEQGPRDEVERSSTVGELQIDAIGTFFQGRHVDTEIGFTLNAYRLENELGGLYQNVFFDNASFRNVALYVEPEITPAEGLRIRPGLRLHVYRTDFNPTLEPRLRVVWERGMHQVSAAAGLYHQEIVGVSDRRDASSLFTAWSYIRGVGDRPDDIEAPPLGRAVHGLLGYQITPTSWLNVSVEGFAKDVENLFVAEWTSYPRLTTQLQPATGRIYGFDARIGVRFDAVYGHVSYGYSNTLYEVTRAKYELWFGSETLEFRPPHDRRHQVNALLGASLAGFELNVHWQFGSGLPFSRAVGFGGFLFMESPLVDVGQQGTRRVIYERPYNAELPTFHRLDVSLERTFSWQHVGLTLQASVINVYDRRNVLYFDVFTLRRSDQLPLVPSFGMKLRFE